MKQTLLEFLGGIASADELLFEEAQLGGRDVVIMLDSPESQGVLVVLGDTAYAIVLR